MKVVFDISKLLKDVGLPPPLSVCAATCLPPLPHLIQYGKGEGGGR